MWGHRGARVLRGGSWNNNDNNVRAANRNRNEPTNENNNLGFRCALPYSALSGPLGVERLRTLDMRLE